MSVKLTIVRSVTYRNRCGGRITLGEGSSTLRDALRIGEAGSQKDPPESQRVTYIDSSGIGELVSAYTTITNQGGHLKLLMPHAPREGPAADTSFTRVFDVHETKPYAVPASHNRA